MNPGEEHSWTIPIGDAQVKPLYFRFLGERDRGQLPKDMTWSKYEKLHAGEK